MGFQEDLLKMCQRWWVVIDDKHNNSKRWFCVAEDGNNRRWIQSSILRCFDETFDAPEWRTFRSKPVDPHKALLGAELREGYRAVMVSVDQAMTVANESATQLLELVNAPHAFPTESVLDKSNAIRIGMTKKSQRRNVSQKTVCIARIIAMLHQSDKPILEAELVQEFGIADRTWRSWKEALRMIPEVSFHSKDGRIWLTK